MKAAAFFDLDKTIIAKSSVLAFGKSFYREGLLSRRAIARSAYAQVVYMLVGADEAKMEKVREAMLAMTRGWNQEHVASIVRETLDDVVTPIIYSEAVELIEEHRAAGRKVVIISSSPQEVVEPLADHLGADDAIGTRAELDGDGDYTGRLAFYAYGPNKAVAIREMATREGIDLDTSYAYSDSITDIPMLETVGHPVAVNPDRELARAADEREWEILHFHNPVSLRKRVHAPPPGPTMAVGGIVLAAGAGAAAWWWLRRNGGPGAGRARGPTGNGRTARRHRGRRAAHRAGLLARGGVGVARSAAGAAVAVRRVASGWSEE
ncbi:MAG TPA: HAD family hydrolase [Acidimicrobiia bacterium]|nr:HAD family hydrolase [Acidimicrobiia bacterium]